MCILYVVYPIGSAGDRTLTLSVPPQRARRPYRAWRGVHDGSKVKVRVDKRDWIYNIEITPAGVTEDNHNAKTPICGSLHRWTSIVLYYNLMSS